MWGGAPVFVYASASPMYRYTTAATTQTPGRGAARQQRRHRVPWPPYPFLCLGPSERLTANLVSGQKRRS